MRSINLLPGPEMSATASRSDQRADQHPTSSSAGRSNRGRRGKSYGVGSSSQPTGHSAQFEPAVRKLSKLDYDPAEHQLINHLPRKLPRGPNDVYITLKTPFTAQMKKCRKLLETPGCREIMLHGMGAATNRAVNLALRLKDEFGNDLLELSPNTTSIKMTDELEPLRDDLDPISQSRFVSVIKIRIFFTETLEDLRNTQKLKT